MIIIRLQGGLGNQMFQYAFGRAMALKKKTTLAVDTSAYKDYKLRKYGLDAFKISGKPVDNKLFDKYINDRLRIPKNLFFRYFGWLPNIFPYNYIFERKGKFNKNYFRLPGDLLLEGFWQSESYFVDCEAEIRKEFEIKSKIDGKFDSVIKEMKKTESVSLHIRRTDYVSNPVAAAQLGFCGLEYYKKACRYIEAIVKKPKYYVFTDDIDWTMKNLELKHKTRYVSGGKDYEEMYLMSCCKHNIIANSSFSWWGAWLNNNKEKIVIAPKKWFNDGRNSDTLVPKSWMRL